MYVATGPDLGPEKAACHGSGSSEEGSCSVDTTMALYVWATFTFYQVLCHLISPLCSAAVVKGVTPSSSSFYT